MKAGAMRATDAIAAALSACRQSDIKPAPKLRPIMATGRATTSISLGVMPRSAKRNTFEVGDTEVLARKLPHHAALVSLMGD